MTLTAFSFKIEGLSPTHFGSTDGTLYLYKVTSGAIKTELAKASVKGANTVTCAISSSYALTSTDKLEVYYSEKNGAVKIHQLKYSYTPAAVATPTFSVPAGLYASAQNVTITCATEGAEIYYTTGGTTPTSASTPYTGAIDIDATTPLKAIAIKGSDASAIAFAAYGITTHEVTADAPLTVAEAIAYINALDGEVSPTDVYVRGYVSDFDGTTNSYPDYWISDDGTKTNQMQVYSGRGIGGSTVADIWSFPTGDIVTVKGKVQLVHYYTYNRPDPYPGFLKESEIVSLEPCAYITDAGYATFYRPYATDFSGTSIEVYTAAVNGDKVMLTPVESKKVPANTGVVLKGSTTTVSKIASADALSNNELILPSGYGLDTESNLIYVLAKKNSVVGFYRLDSQSSVPTGKAYLNLGNDPYMYMGPAPEYLGFDFNDGNTTDLNELKGKVEEVSGEMFDLSGRRVQNPTKGLYIVNGKKVVIK